MTYVQTLQDTHAEIESQEHHVFRFGIVILEKSQAGVCSRESNGNDGPGILHSQRMHIFAICNPGYLSRRWLQPNSRP
jgi:hypothetical protein